MASESDNLKLHGLRCVFCDSDDTESDLIDDGFFLEGDLSGMVGCDLDGESEVEGSLCSIFGLEGESLPFNGLCIDSRTLTASFEPDSPDVNSFKDEDYDIYESDDDEDNFGESDSDYCIED